MEDSVSEILSHGRLDQAKAKATAQGETTAGDIESSVNVHLKAGLSENPAALANQNAGTIPWMLGGDVPGDVQTDNVEVRPPLNDEEAGTGGQYNAVHNTLVIESVHPTNGPTPNVTHLLEAMLEDCLEGTKSMADAIPAQNVPVPAQITNEENGVNSEPGNKTGLTHENSEITMVASPLEPNHTEQTEQANISNKSEAVSDSDLDITTDDSPMESDDDDSDDVGSLAGIPDLAAIRNLMDAADEEPATHMIRSRHEEEQQLVLPIPQVQILPEDKIKKLGHISSIVGTTLVIESSADHDDRALDQGTVLCLADRTVVGALHDTISKVRKPMYTICYKTTSDINEFSLAPGVEVFYLEREANYVFPQQLRQVKYTDASNIYDEEVGSDDAEFSDDEKEQEKKRRKRRSNRDQGNRGRGRGRGGFGNNCDRGHGRKGQGRGMRSNSYDNRHQSYEEGQAEGKVEAVLGMLNYDEASHGDYNVNRRPDTSGFGHGLPSAALPPRPTSPRGRYSSRHNQGRRGDQSNFQGGCQSNGYRSRSSRNREQTKSFTTEDDQAHHFGQGNTHFGQNNTRSGQSNIHFAQANAGYSQNSAHFGKDHNGAYFGQTNTACPEYNQYPSSSYGQTSSFVTPTPAAGSWAATNTNTYPAQAPLPGGYWVAPSQAQAHDTAKSQQTAGYHGPLVFPTPGPHTPAQADPFVPYHGHHSSASALPAPTHSGAVSMLSAQAVNGAYPSHPYMPHQQLGRLVGQSSPNSWVPPPTAGAQQDHQRLA